MGKKSMKNTKRDGKEIGVEGEEKEGGEKEGGEKEGGENSENVKM